MTILVATADAEVARSLGAALRRAGRPVQSCDEAAQASEVLERDEIRVLVVDGDLPGREEL